MILSGNRDFKRRFRATRRSIAGSVSCQTTASPRPGIRSFSGPSPRPSRSRHREGKPGPWGKGRLGNKEHSLLYPELLPVEGSREGHGLNVAVGGGPAGAAFGVWQRARVGIAARPFVGGEVLVNFDRLHGDR